MSFSGQLEQPKQITGPLQSPKNTGTPRMKFDHDKERGEEFDEFIELLKWIFIWKPGYVYLRH